MSTNNHRRDARQAMVDRALADDSDAAENAYVNGPRIYIREDHLVDRYRLWRIMPKNMNSDDLADLARICDEAGLPLSVPESVRQTVLDAILQLRRAGLLAFIPPDGHEGECTDEQIRACLETEIERIDSLKAYYVDRDRLPGIVSKLEADGFYVNGSNWSERFFSAD